MVAVGDGVQVAGGRGVATGPGDGSRPSRTSSRPATA